MQLDQALNLIGENFQTLNRMGVESLAAFGSTAHGEASPDQIDRVWRFLQISDIGLMFYLSVL